MWIDNDNDFAEWCREAQTHPAIAVDTEFVWTKTYYPDLGLLQMAWDREHSALVDVLTITDISPLARLLQAQDTVKIFHEAASDLPILRRWCGGGILPQNIFDTRIAAGFCGLTASLSLNKLLTQVLGITLAKTETRTDWLQRPLSAAQLDYASGDVEYMPELHTALVGRLNDYGNTAWFNTVMQAYSLEETYSLPNPGEAWRRVSRNGLFEGPSLAVIREVAAWRESFAAMHNIARPRLISDEQICACAEHLPKTQEDLIHAVKMWKKNAERYGAQILNAVSRGLSTPPESLPHHPAMSMDSKTLRARADRIKSLVAKRSEARGIDSMLVATRKEMESLVFAAASKPWPFSHELLNGWKRELLGDTIEELARTNFGAPKPLPGLN